MQKKKTKWEGQVEEKEALQALAEKQNVQYNAFGTGQFNPMSSKLLNN